MKKELLIEARSLFDGITPMMRDCGKICDAACCQPDEDGQGGVHLFPGEEELLGEISWGKIIDDEIILGGKKARILVCDGPCSREKRPLACMIFPLTPEMDEKGRVDVRFDMRARAMCPLLRHGMRGLRRDFVATVGEALQLIAQDAEGNAFLRDWEKLERQYDLKL